MWAQNSLWACVGILVSGLMKLGPKNLYLNTYDQNQSMATNPKPIAAYPRPKPIHDSKPMTNKTHTWQQTRDQN